jgi:hypothetical protein
VVDNRGNRRGSLQNSAGRATSVRGAEDFLALSKRLKEAGESGLRKELNRAVQAIPKPLIPKVKAAARAKLPSKGGMNEHYARKRYRVQARTGQNTAGVRIASPKTDPRVDSVGRIAHPVFGRPRSRVVQRVPGAAGFFSETIQAEAPQIRRALVETVEAFAQRIQNGG